jgi:hypothetical protein
MYGEMEHPYVKYVREDLYTALQARLAKVEVEVARWQSLFDEKHHLMLEAVARAKTAEARVKALVNRMNCTALLAHLMQDGAVEDHCIGQVQEALDEQMAALADMEKADE